MSKPITLVFCLAVLSYFICLEFFPTLVWLAKILPILLLLFAVKNQRPSSHFILISLILALLFSGTGDLLLAFDQFIYGVVAFLIAQLCYALIFLSYWQGIKRRWPLTLCLLLYVIVMVYALLEHLGDLTGPVMAYLSAITLMGVLALQSSIKLRYGVLGALTFILSDSFIAIDKFITPLPYDSYLIMSSYYAAQYMLIKGFLTSKAPAN